MNQRRNPLTGLVPDKGEEALRKVLGEKEKVAAPATPGTKPVKPKRPPTLREMLAALLTERV